MRAEFHLFGRVINMSRQSRRRKLVIGLYAAALLTLAIGYPLDHWHFSGSYLLIGISLIASHVLGGNGINGLIRPFNNHKPHTNEQPPSLLALQLKIYDPLLSDDPCWQNDERELAERDRAHFRAYAPLCLTLLAVWLVSRMAVHVPLLVRWLPVSPLVLIEGITLLGILLALTLPQAILLWTEPDMVDE